jgi:carboxyl-terminal processing protease
MKKIWLSLMALSLVAGALFFVPPANAADVVVEPVPKEELLEDSDDNVYEQMELLTEMLLLVKKYHVEEHEFDELVYAAIGGMLRSLDAHSAFMDPDEYKAMKEETRGAYGGIGVKIGMRRGILTVIAPIEDSPGFRAGLQSGDKILGIDEEETIGTTLGEAVKKMRGAKGKKVVLSVLGEGDSEPHDVEIIRDVIEVSSIKGAAMLTDGIAYVRITQFARPTAELLHKALKKLEADGMQALILDLRGNPGGLLKQAVFVAETFLKRGDTVVSTKGRAGVTKGVKHTAHGSVHYRDIPLVVLINSGSASASEIVAGAMQDYGRGVLIGETSYGKGSVQSVIPSRTDGKSAIRVTTAYYYTPKGRMIHHIGLEPDIEIDLSREEWRQVQVKRMQLESPAAYSDAEKEEYANVVDRQLERAVDLLKAVLIYNGSK